MKSISFEQYFRLSHLPVLVDVRSEGEYERGHVPGAFNIPLFNNSERAEVGTLYKKTGKEEAMLRGLAIAGTKITEYIKRADEISQGKELAIHCWRGGMRSAGISSLLGIMGFNVFVLKGGYKAYRHFVRKEFKEQGLQLIVLGGKTGAGKTEVLKMLSAQGEQVVDLEKLAHHKGSAFGALGESTQPSVEQFENDLHDCLRMLDLSKRIWVENESRSIGKIFIPDALWEKMATAVFMEIEVPIECRVSRLVNQYNHFPKSELIAAVMKIQKRMGGQNVKVAIEAFENGDVCEATAIALNYYDKAYQYATDQKQFSKKHVFQTDNFDPCQTAKYLIEKADEYGY